MINLLNSAVLYNFTHFKNYWLGILKIFSDTMGKSASKLSADKLHQYLQNTAFSESEVKLHYKLFMNEFPDGKVDQSQFMNVYKVFHPDGKPDQFAMHVFRVFDNERKGVLGFDDFIKALNVTARGRNSFIMINTKGNMFLHDSMKNNR